MSNEDHYLELVKEVIKFPSLVHKTGTKEGNKICECICYVNNLQMQRFKEAFGITNIEEQCFINMCARKPTL